MVVKMSILVSVKIVQGGVPEFEINDGMICPVGIVGQAQLL